MANDHFLPWFVGDFMASTATWTGPERGLYIQLLGIQWSAGSLPSDLMRLARAVNYTIEEFQALWPIMASKFGNGDGKLTNSRLEKIRTYNSRLQEARKSKAKAAAAARWHPSMPQAMLRQSSMHVSDPIRSDPNPNRTEPSKNTTARKRARLSEEPEGFAEFRQVYPPRAGSQPWQRAIKCWRALIGEGIEPTALIAGAKRYAAYIAATGREHTETVLQAATFLGPEKHFENLYPAPAKPESAWDEIQRLNGGHDASSRVFDAEPSRPSLAAPFRPLRSGSA